MGVKARSTDIVGTRPGLHRGNARRPRWATRLASVLLALLLAVTPVVTVPYIGQVGSVMPANASFSDCGDMVKVGLELTEEEAKGATDPKFIGCAGKIAGGDALSIAVGVIFAALGADNRFTDYDSCIDLVRNTVVGLIVDGIKQLVYQAPVIGQVIDAALQPVGSSLTDFMNAAADDLWTLLQNTFKPVFDYIDCGCKVAGTLVALAHKSVELVEKTAACADTVATALADAAKAIISFPEKVGEWVECGLNSCAGGGQDAATNYVYPACQPGWLIGNYVDNFVSNTDGGYLQFWTPNGSCTCPDGTSYKSKGPLTGGDTKYHMSSKVSDASYFACTCDNKLLGYQNGSVCAKCPSSGPINADGTCPACDFGQVSVNGVCKKCGADEFIRDGVCVKGPQCGDGWKTKRVASTDPYSPATVTCEPACADGSIYDVGSKSCQKCKANEYAIYEKPTLGPLGDFANSQTLGVCAKCAKGLYSPPGSMKCCPAGMASYDGIACVPSKKLDLSHPEFSRRGRTARGDQSIAVPAETEETRKTRRSRCPDGQVATSDGECQRPKGRTAPDLALPSERVGSDPSRVQQHTIAPGLQEPTDSRGHTPSAPSTHTVAPGIVGPTDARRSAPSLPSTHTVAPGIQGPTGPSAPRGPSAPSLSTTTTPGRMVPVSPTTPAWKP
ncbi:hypothetical protein [uncultured Bradyrhizobium sp.]|uniref:hypothetical protein n=1 Tax=Bradyrhizobium sp. TaxID=376 RepID=UPI0026048BCF|nr:hypothetical protein [uncultured Bradyrhizobium sp.]